MRVEGDVRAPGRPVPGLLFRIIILFGPRRGEAVGLRWAGADLDAGLPARGRATVLHATAATITEGTAEDQGRRPADLAGRRDRRACCKAHRTAQLEPRLDGGASAWQDNDLIFCRDDGTPWQAGLPCRAGSRRPARRLAGLPVIKLHEGRHSAASLARDAAVDPEIRRRTLGHADAAMTAHYTQTKAEAHKAAAEAVAKLVDKGR